MRAAILGLEVKPSGEVLTVAAKILRLAVAKMPHMHCLEVFEGEVLNVEATGKQGWQDGPYQLYPKI